MMRDAVVQLVDAIDRDVIDLRIRVARWVGSVLVSLICKEHFQPGGSASFVTLHNEFKLWLYTVVMATDSLLQVDLLTNSGMQGEVSAG